MQLLQEVLLERGTWCRTSTSMDLKTIHARVEHEGLSFLTITLPSFGKDLEKGLDQGKVDRSLFQGFSWKGGLPRFLRGFLGLVFDRGTGLLLDQPSIEAIRAIRQITLMFGKVAVKCSDEREAAAMQAYIKCEKEVREADGRRTHAEMAQFQRIVSLLLAPALSAVDNSIAQSKPVPRHGPGSTAEKLLGNQKYSQHEWTERLEKVFPSSDYLIPSPSYYHELDRVDFLEPGRERPVRVISVPKTLKTPRIIAIEPVCMMYTQQALMEVMVEAIEGDDFLSSFIGFTDQTPNQRMACEGSLSGELATLDLSEASDRVSNQLVRAMTARHPHLAEGLDACRSRKADVNGHGVIRLAKFASMGSALCFPVEAMVFCSLVFLGIQDELNRPLTRKDLKSFRGQVRVYGDDIIVPVRFVQAVIRRLEDFGLLVNAGKSFWTGKFRESCGKEYYDGEDVSIVRVRQMLPSSPRDATGVISTVSLRNQMYFHGSWETAKWLDGWLKRVIPLPTVATTSPVLGRHSLLGHETQLQETGHTLQRPLVKGYVVREMIPHNPVSESAALLKWFLKRGEMPFADRRHLMRSGRPKSVDIKLRWASAT